MKIIVAGSRSITDAKLVGAIISSVLHEQHWKITELVSGAQKGTYKDGVWVPTVDGLGEAWARKWSIPIKLFPANWAEHGKRAGPLRNEVMAIYADVGIIIWDGLSRGSGNMIEELHKLGKPVIVRTRR